MVKNYFITGTDTGVGKTWATLALMHYFKQQGYTVAGMKPIAAGCQWRDQQLKNEDALLLQENASIPLDYSEVNPCALEMPLAPHLVAKDKVIDLTVIADAYQNFSKKNRYSDC